MNRLPLWIVVVLASLLAPSARADEAQEGTEDAVVVEPALPSSAEGEAPPEGVMPAPAEAASDGSAPDDVTESADPADDEVLEDSGGPASQAVPSSSDTAPLEDPARDGATGEAPYVQLRSSRAADERLAVCVPLVAARQDAEARACLDDVLALGDDTTAALRASALLGVLSAGETEPEPGFAIPPGRLELSATSGLFGVWNGIAGGISIAAHAESLPAAPLILGTGALAVGLGIGYGVAGYALADALDLGEGDSRLVASGLVWGTTFGIASLPALLDIARPEGPLQLSLSLATVVASGFVGGGAALGIASFGEFSAPQVSLINTGGWVGGLFGLLTLASLAPFAPPLPLYSLGYVTVGATGLIVGGLSGLLLDLSWGETVLLDLGAVLGTVTAGAIVMSVTASGALNRVPATVGIPLNSAATALGTLAGLGATLGGIAFFRATGSPVLRSLEASALTVLPPAPSFVLDKEGQLTPMLLAPTFVF